MKAHRLLMRLAEADFTRPYGHVCRLGAGVIEATGPASILGDLCDIDCEGDEAGAARTVAAEVAAVDERRVVLIPLEPHLPISTGARVTARRSRGGAPVGQGFAGRAVDALGRPIDGGGRVEAEAHVPIAGSVPAPLERGDPARLLVTGIRAIDGLLPLGEGQRVGIFAASGVGKTSLVEQLSAQIECDHVLLCLVGERGREVEAIWRGIAQREDRARYTLVAATSDESAPLRARAANYTLCLAEHWRAAGKHVLLLVDSVTRLAMALREIGLAAGAPPTVRAYTPNVFSALPRLVERCGAAQTGGAISAIMTVLSETDDVDDPIVEVMKSLLDGHIVLSRTLAEQGHFPAIDVTRSVSRGGDGRVEPVQAAAMRDAVAMLSAYEEARVMIESGVYRTGTNKLVDRAIAARPALSEFLRQQRREKAAPADTVRRLTAITAAGHA